MLKRILSALTGAVLALSLSVTAFADIEYREEEVSVPPRMLYLGDSIATGCRLEGYENGRENVASYANILKEKYSAELPEDCPYEMTNLAIDGQTSEELLADLIKGVYDEEFDVDVIVISIGGNDLLHILLNILNDADVHGTDDLGPRSIYKIVTALTGLSDTVDQKLAVYEENIANIASYINARTEGKLIVQTLYNPFDGFSLVPGFEDFATERIERLDNIIREASQDGEAFTVCDTVPLFDDRAQELTNIADFDIHPNAEGHKLIAEELDKIIRKDTYTYMKAYEVEPSSIDEPEPEAEPAQADSVTDETSKAGSEADDESGLKLPIVLGSIALVAAVSAVVVIFVKKNKGKKG